MFTEQYQKAIWRRLIPPPEKITFGEGFCILQQDVCIEILTAVSLSSEEMESARKSLSKFHDFVPVLTFKTDPSSENIEQEQYSIRIKPDFIRIRAKSYHGTDYAMKTLRQLSEPVRGVETITHEMLPCCEIEDKPALGFRAIHFCILPETSMTTVIKNIRLAAYHKFNYAVIESWGVFPFRSHPAFSWSKQKKQISEFEALRAAAKDCGITIIPQFNILGHASLSRNCTAKHAVLDEHPKLSPLFEPEGWSFCLSNPATKQILLDLCQELFEFFGKPPYFHLGCDEAADFPSCADCASRDTSKLIADHIIRFHDYFAKQGARVIMWHDMLLQLDDPRWKSCIILGSKATSRVLSLLPKDVIIADWQYGPSPGKDAQNEWPTSLFFQEQGFDVAVCPWMHLSGMLSLCEMAVRHKMFGMIETTWHTAYGANFESMLIHASIFSWHGADPDPALFPNIPALARHLRDVARDMGLTEYEDFGSTTIQTLRETVSI